VNWDARITQPIAATYQLMHVTEPLVHRDNDMNTVGWLAESWEPDERGWRFFLRKGVKFHNGEDFDAESVKYTIESFADPDLTWVNPQSRSYVDVISEVVIEDPHTVLLVTDRFSRALVSNLSAVTMLPPAYASEMGEQFGTSPVGTGRYRFVEYVAGSHAVLEANADHWDQPPLNAGLEIRYLTENATRLAALETGEVLLINNVPPDSVGRLEGNGDLVVVTIPTNRLMQIHMQYDQGVFADKLVRHALNHAINKEAIASSIMGGLGEVARNPWHPSMLGTNDGLPQYEYDPERARQLLAEAGHPNGVDVAFGSPANRYLQDKLVAEAIAQQIAEAGFNATLDAREWGSFWQSHNERQYDMALLGYSTPTFDPAWASQWFATQSLIGFENPQVQELFAQADATDDLEEADRLYQEAQAIIWDDGPFAFLYFQPTISAHSTTLTGWAPRPDEYDFYWNAEIS
jgi:peptide/nickel transport system substrate-binding protein